MAPTRYVIVGGSAAGMAAAQAIRELDSHGAITVLSAEADPPYYRPLIPFIVDGRKTAGEIGLLGQGPYTAQDIDVRLDAAVTTVDTQAHAVTVHDAETISYDKLLVATGSRPYIPSSIQGTDAPGVYALRTLADARSMAERANTTLDAVMAGGGMLNLKAAFALLERGLGVTLVVTSPEVLSQVMEPDGAALIRDGLERAGLRILTGRSVTQIVAGPDGVTGVLLDSGEELSCEIVCIGKGVRPNVEFLAGSGVRVEQGIVADTHTACNTPDTYTAGDVAVTFDPITGKRMMTALWTNAVEMGRCAGRNMAGRPTAYGGTFGILNATQVAETPFVSMGIVHTTGTDYETHVFQADDVYRKLTFTADGERLVGAVFVGEIARAGLYRHLIRERVQLNGLKAAVVEHRLHYGDFLRL
ncbi:MAG: NAD(P)/FAD-dependent oxidoreductase [Chloroflexi bacterium]|nr:MAG: NAD(P)/FAD-dependent oxidoreductase [Chloroflexota bacterium]RLC84821.1 MAG: NAD(P)/FAD-dependent oxidoreductase [Chloroflexota bacterium]